MRRTRAALLLSLTAAILAACSGGDDAQPLSSSQEIAAGSSDAASPSPSAQPSTSPPTSGGDSQTVKVFFSRRGSGDECTSVEPVDRRIEKTRSVATAALNELLAGPTETEQDRGFGSLFNDETAGLLRSVRVERGTAFLDLNAGFLRINNVSTSCAGSATVASIEATLRQFPTVEEVRYAVEADPAAFYDFMQMGCPQPPSAGDRCDPAPFRRD